MDLAEMLSESRRKFYLGIVEKYNRRCRRLTAIYTAGRKVDDHIILQRTDMMRIGYETAIKELTN